MGGEENLIKQLLPRLCKSDTGQTRTVFLSYAVDLEVRDNRSERTEITRRRPETESDPKGAHGSRLLMGWKIKKRKSKISRASGPVASENEYKTRRFRNRRSLRNFNL